MLLKAQQYASPVTRPSAPTVTCCRYDEAEDDAQIDLTPLSQIGPKLIRKGSDITLVGVSYTTKMNLLVAEELAKQGISADVIDLRVINPLNYSEIVESVKRTGRLCVVDGCWTNCGLAGEIIAGVSERVEPITFKVSPKRFTLTDVPAPTSKALESNYYIKHDDIVRYIKSVI